MTSFTNKLANAPIYNAVNPTTGTNTFAQQSTLTNDNGSQTGATADDSDANNTHPLWQKWFNQVSNYVNINNYYGNPNILYNGDFNFNSGVIYPVTVAGNISTFWAIKKTGSVTFSVSSQHVVYNSADQIGSANYLTVTIANFAAGDTLTIYQIPTQNSGSGWEYLHRLQGRNLSCSGLLTNSGTTTVKGKFQITFNFTGSTAVYTGKTAYLAVGSNEISTQIQIPYIASTQVVENTSTTESAFVITDVPGGSGVLDLYYFKNELADTPTVLYVDHPLEKTRIANA